jgi:hypothetical protein
MKLSTRVLAVLAVASLSLAAAGSAQGTVHSPAKAGDTVTVTHGSYTIGISKEVRHDFNIRVAGKTAEGKTTVTVAFKKYSGNCLKDLDSAFKFEYLGGDLWGETLGFEPAELLNSCAGKAPYTVVVTDKDGASTVTTTVQGSITLRRASKFVKLNAGPEPVKKGHTVTTKAVIERANWDDLKYHTYAGQKSELQFRTSTGSYKNVKSVLAKTGGKLTGSAKQSVKGCWRYTFAGTGVTAPITAGGDCVAVKH